MKVNEHKSWLLIVFLFFILVAQNLIPIFFAQAQTSGLPAYTASCKSDFDASQVPWPQEDSGDCQSPFIGALFKAGDLLSSIKAACSNRYQSQQREYIDIVVRYSTMPPQVGLPLLAAEGSSKFSKEIALCFWAGFVDTLDISKENKDSLKNSFEFVQKAKDVSKLITQGVDFKDLSEEDKRKLLSKFDKNLKKPIEMMEKQEKVNATSFFEDLSESITEHLRNHENEVAVAMGKAQAFSSSCTVDNADAALGQANSAIYTALFSARQAVRITEKDLYCQNEKFYTLYGADWKLKLPIFAGSDSPGDRAMVILYNKAVDNRNRAVRKEVELAEIANQIGHDCKRLRKEFDFINRLRQHYFKLKKQVEDKLSATDCKLSGITNMLQSMSNLEGGKCAQHLAATTNLEQTYKQKKADCDKASQLPNLVVPIPPLQSPTPILTPEPTETIAVTLTPEPTETIAATLTPELTATITPTAMPRDTLTPTPIVKKGKDKILSCTASSAAGSRVSRPTFTQGDPLFINVEVQAGDGIDGQREISITHLGKAQIQTSVFLKDGERTIVTFPLNSYTLQIPSNMSVKSFIFHAKLSSKETKGASSKTVHFRLKKKPMQNSGGLQNVYCASPNVVIKVWDHGEQDGDRISLMLGNQQVLSNFNLNQCRGPGEPRAGSCVRQGSLTGGRVGVSIMAHNEGTSSPNTASIKVDGGCTPEVQHWDLKTGGVGSLWVFYGQPPLRH